MTSSELTWRRSKKGLSYRIFLEQIKSSRKRRHSPPAYSLKELRNWLDNQTDFNKLYAAWVNSNFKPLLRPTCDRKDDFKAYSFQNITVMSLINNRKKHHQDVISGIDQRTCKGVIQYTLDGQYIDHFHSQSAASRATDTDQSNISAVCRGMKPHANGFCWQFA